MSDGIIAQEDYDKDKKEFDDTLDAVFNADSELTDEEINKALDKELGKKSDGSGESTDDLTVKPDVDPDKVVVDPDKVVVDPDQVDPDTGVDKTDWKAKYEESDSALTKEQQKTKSWDGRIQAANKKAEAAEIALADAVKAKPAEPTEEELSDQDKLDKFRKEFPELKDVVDIMEKRIDKGKTKAPAKQAEPKKEEPATDEVDTKHLDTIKIKHPELDEMVGTGVLSTWIETQGEYIRPSLKRIYTSGTSEEVVSMLTEFKKQSGWKSQLNTTDSKAKAKEEKLNSMKDVNSTSGGPKDNEGPDKNDYDKGVADAFKDEKK